MSISLPPCFSAEYPWAGHHSFSNLNVSDGLSQNSINAIVQDRLGYIWFGSADGLNRFDGYEVKVYRNEPTVKQQQLSSNVILSLFSDSEDQLWVGTKQGVDRYHYQSDVFTSFPLLRNNDTKKHRGSAFFQDFSGRFWVGSSTGGLFYFDQKLQQFVATDFNLKKDYNAQKIYTIEGNQKKALYIGTRNGLYIYNTMSKKSQHYTFAYPGVQQKSANIVTSILPLPDNELLIGTLDGLYLLSLTEEKYTAFYPKKDAIDSLSHRSVERIVGNKKDGIWIGTSGGLNLFNLATKTFQRTEHVKSRTDSLSDNRIRSLYIDSFNNLWVGLSNFGVDKLNLLNHQFGLHYKKEATDTCLANSTHFNILRSRAGELWVDSLGKGLHRISKDGKNCRWYKIDRTAVDGLAGTLSPGSLFEDSRGDIWFGTINGPVYRLRHRAKQFTKYYPDSLKANAIRSGAVRDIVEDKKGNLWFATDSGGISFFDYDKETFTSYLHDPNAANSLSDNYVFALALDEDQLWIGTADEGLERYSIRNNAFTQFAYSQDRSDGFKVGIYSLHNDKNDYLWAGTRGMGLARINKRTEAIHYFTTADGLSDNTVYKIVQDNQSVLWLATNRGITRFDPKTSAMTRFSVADGLQHDEFTPGGFFDSQNNHIYFASIGGFNRFDPLNIKLDSIKPKMAITGLNLFNKPSDSLLINKLSNLSTIDLQHHQNMLTIKFSGLHFGDPSRQKYQYQLAGFDNQWIESDAKSRFATYTNLPAGNYVFKVKATNRHGVWSDEKQVALAVYPPFWLTWWAKLFYAVTALMVLSGFYLLRTRAMRARNKQLEAVVSARTNELLKEKQRVEKLLHHKSKEFENIAHEFRTPLTIIMGRAQQSKKTQSSQDGQDSFDVIEKVSRQLAATVDDVIAMGRATHLDTMDAHPPISISNMIHAICEQMQPFAELKQQTLKTEIESNIYQRCVPKAMEKVFNNLISNAIKYTQEKGQIDVRLSKNGAHYQFEVQDNGMGIAPVDQTKVFERFYRSEQDGVQQAPGSGIGLALVKESIEAHKGDIALESEFGEGSRFIVSLPSDERPEKITPYHVDNEAISLLMTPANEEKLLSVSQIEDDKSNKPLLLMVEDNPEMRMLLAAQLNAHYRLRDAVNGVDGFKLASELLPDVIVSDINMPLMNGYTLLNELKNDCATSHIPVILLTAKSEAAARIEGFRYKADGYIGKPYLVDELLALIQSQLDNRKLIREQVKLALENNHDLNQSGADEHTCQVITKCLTFIEDNYQKPELSVQSLIDIACLSERQLRRKFHDFLGVSPREFINDYRLKLARPMVHKGHRINEVASKTGFSNANYFSRQYKKKYGLSPSEDMISTTSNAKYNY